MPKTFSQPSPGPVEPDLALHQGFLRASPEPSPEPCWTWPGASQTFSGILRNPVAPVEPDFPLHPGFMEPSLDFRNPVEPHLSPHRIPDLLGNLRNLLRNLVEPDPVPAPVHTGAILGWRPRQLTLLEKKKYLSKEV